MKRNGSQWRHMVAWGAISVLLLFAQPQVAGDGLRIEPEPDEDPPCVRVIWETEVGFEYELQASGDLVLWTAVPGFPRIGSGGLDEETFPMEGSRRFFRLVITAETVPPGMVAVPEGSFSMGDHFGDGLPSELPVHEVYVSAFFMAEHPVTWGEWKSVRDWAITNGYEFDGTGGGKADNHPAHSMTWFDMVKWCNARSEMEGLDPVYFLDAAHTEVFRTGQSEIGNEQVRWDGSGYRLPTEAEWEKAARGGLYGRRFPWGDTISHQEGNYWAGFPPVDYDEDFGENFHPDYEVGNTPYTSPVGAFAPNGFGLYDMAGNVWERCWDNYAATYYTESSEVPDPRGPVPGDGLGRIIRGGSWIIGASNCRVSDRFFAKADLRSDSWGFRVVRQMP